MPFFRYRATDLEGRVAEGTLFAPDEAQARSSLTRQGHTVLMLDGGGSAPAGPAVRPAPSDPIAAPGSRRLESPADMQWNTPSSRAPRRVVRTRVHQDRRLYLIFSQLAVFLRSGTNPKLAFEHLAERAGRFSAFEAKGGPLIFFDVSVPRKDYAHSLRYLATAVGEGMSLSDGLACFPDLYPADVVGAIRAGELGGFLPEACERVAQQTMDSHAFKRKATLAALWFSLPLSLIPIVFFIQRASISTMERQEAAGSSLPPVQTFLEEAQKVSPAIFGFVIGLFTVVLVTQLILRSPPLRSFRHRVVATYWPLSARTRAESLGQFAWALSRVSAAGVAPATAWRAAADAMPNEVLRDRMRSAWGNLGTTGRLSQALEQSRLIGPDHLSLVQTGEVAGDVPGMMDRLAKIEDSRFKGFNQSLPVAWYFALFIFAAVLVGAAVAYFYSNYFNSLFRIILGDT